MHSILKDGSYIQYGPKIIPNPNAEGGGGGGKTGIETVKIEFEFEENPGVPINATDMMLGTFGTGPEPLFDTLVYSYHQSGTMIIEAPILDNLILYTAEMADISDGEHYWILDTEEPIISVQGSAEIIAGTTQIYITGDCSIKLKVVAN